MSQQQTIVKYGVFFLFSLLICISMFWSEKYWLPAKWTQEMLLTDNLMKNGMAEHFLDLRDQAVSGKLPLVQDVAYPVSNPAYKGVVIKMSESGGSTALSKYRFEMSFFYPYSGIPRVKKLEAIIVNVNKDQPPQFADLFWNIK